jgi:hypothetical protein
MDVPLPETAHDSRIRGLSRFLSAATLGLMAVMPLMAWGPWLWPGVFEMIGRSGQVPGNGFGGGLDWFVWPLRLGAAGIATVALLVALYGLMGLRDLFRACAEGRYFSAGAVSGFRQFALASLVNAIWAPFEHTLMGVYLSVSNPNVPNALEIALGSDHVQAIGLALVFFLIAHILAEGRRRHEELELIL